MGEREHQSTDNPDQRGLPDASEVPDYEAVEDRWTAFLAEEDSDTSAVEPEVRKQLGLSTPTSVVGSAEGSSQFRGLRINGNGKLDAVHTLLLRSKIGELDPGVLEDGKPSPPPDRPTTS